ncbi:hypothetical protein A3C24_04070 [Candidatus Roizmanbacteria bacterium RIFCSPHIGHO2_02_FULL_37_24]|uniref:Radical SAM core domain-containing protein n=1 Tax=Candidatus Roizmanbacteria bacterium RIFCSPHIGHO2_02_FULL_37_24 TaxID=1802037 RepID=A0A1F7GVB3_9BACT|nr:MAG: hypothetical protein A3C24_04070 [Candidatus Roizmanbacteria bacterium RIFCSPHIGHO2_02_FULL_37_24]HLD62024.1 radical SAM protein [Patescibacteria group bacterium]
MNAKNNSSENNLPYRVVRVGLTCNINCIFCNIPIESGAHPARLGFTEIKKEINEIFSKEKHPKISISGGEPTIHPDIIKIIKYLKKKGAAIIDLQTNAVLLSNLEFAKKLKKAGLNKIFVSFHSHIPKFHNLLTQSKNGHGRCVQGIKNCLNSGIEVILNPVINSLTYKFLPDYIEFIHKNFPKIKYISLSIVQPHERALKNRKIVPKYELLSPYIEKAAKLADKFGIVANNPYCGLPFCFGGWHKRLDKCLEYSENTIGGGNKSCDKVKLAACEKCDLKNACNGIWRNYLKIHPTLRLKPIKIN